jgi:hypothetical protein
MIKLIGCISTVYVLASALKSGDHHENIYFMNNSFTQKESSFSDVSDSLSAKEPKRENGKSKTEEIKPFFQTPAPSEQTINGTYKNDESILKELTTKQHDRLNIQLIS